MGYGRFCQSVQLFRSFFLAVRAPRHCNGALVASQQARRCNSTSMPPQTNGALTARQLPRRRQKMTPPRSENDVFLVFLEHFQLLKLTIISLHHPLPAVFSLRTVPMRTAFTNYPLYIFLSFMHHPNVGSRPVATASVPTASSPLGGFINGRSFVCMVGTEAFATGRDPTFGWFYNVSVWVGTQILL